MRSMYWRKRSHGRRKLIAKQLSATAKGLLSAWSIAHSAGPTHASVSAERDGAGGGGGGDGNDDPTVLPGNEVELTQAAGAIGAAAAEDEDDDNIDDDDDEENDDDEDDADRDVCCCCWRDSAAWGTNLGPSVSRK